MIIKSEEWRPVKNYENYYLVSNLGNVWSVRRNRQLKPATDKYGYLYYVLSVGGERRTIKAHRMVATAFIDNQFNKPTVNHKNGVRSDNRASNLEWATAKDQANDPLTRAHILEVAQKTDYRKMGATRNFGRKRTAVYKGDILIGTFDSLAKAAEAVGVSCGKASECANGKRTMTGGMRFCYEC